MAVFARRNQSTAAAPGGPGVQRVGCCTTSSHPTTIWPPMSAPVSALRLPPTEDTPKPAAASDKEERNTSPDVWATLTATSVFVAALVVSALFLFVTQSGPTFKAAEGIGAFALFYIVAQAAERLVEMVIPYFDRRPRGQE